MDIQHADVNVLNGFSAFHSFLSSQLRIITVNRSSFLKPRCACAFVLSLFSHVWLCDLVDSSLPDSSLHGILQARILKWVAIPFSRRSSRRRDQTYAAHLLHRQANSLTLVPPWKHQPVPHVVNKQWLKALSHHTSDKLQVKRGAFR